MNRNIIRALRLPFLSASILPFIFGSLINRANFNFSGFILGLITVAATHLSANLINDYADSKSGADWQDNNFYEFFGGSKLIQEKVFSEKFYLKTAIFFAVISSICIIILSVVLKSLLVLGLSIAIVFLSWSYSKSPLRFSYRRLGEVIIFLLFGPALVMGGYFIQTKVFPSLMSFLLSLPFGLLTTAILFANEIPDFNEDRNAGKFTWVSLVGSKWAFLIYYALIIFALLSISLNIYLKFLNPLALFCFVCIFPVLKAGNILKEHYSDKKRLMKSSKLTIAVQTCISIILILVVLL